MIRKDLSAAELDELIKLCNIVVIDFNAAWCGPCKMFAPIFERVAEKNADRAEFVSIDVDRVPELAEKYSVKSIPAIVGIKNGSVEHFSSGLMNEPSFTELIDSLED